MLKYWAVGAAVRDEDGVLHVDYFAELLRQAANSMQRLSTWRESIDGNIRRLEERQLRSQMAKWAWFKDRLEEALRA